METVQMYTIVNNVADQVMGTSAIKAVDTNSFVSLGNAILSSQTMTENFANELVLRIARTIVSYRMYYSRLKPLIFDDIQWGAIVQKVKVQMPIAVSDKAYDLKDGDSVDMYEVRKPKMTQKFFVERTPYSFFVTIQRWQLKRAFLNEGAMMAFINAIFGEIRNKLELTFESLGYLAMDNFIANVTEDQTINLVTQYNADTGSTLATGLAAMNDSDFLRYAIGKMNIMSRKLESMTTIFNAEGAERHTPRDLQRFVVLDEFVERMRTVVQWQAFHEQYVSKVPNIEVPYWQAMKSPSQIIVTNEDGTETTINNVIGFIHDRDALGTYRKESEVLTTPLNARGRYTNTFYHEEQMWFNDLSENGIVFTLN